MKTNNNHNERLLLLFKIMLRIRLFEEEVCRQAKKGNIIGTLHLCIGQEAVAAGCCENLKKGDFVTSTHRGHGHFIAAGASLKRIMAELFGRRDGYCFGKGGTQHMASYKDGFLASNGITGGGIAYAAGIALTLKMQGYSNLAVCFFGDGASNQGTFHESLNIASIWKLPIIYVCENNMYAMSTHIKNMISVQDIAQRGQAYNIVSKVVDGNDVIALSETMAEAMDFVRHSKGPVLIEAKTYRQTGHSINDKCNYVSPEENLLWKDKCPILRLKKYITDNNEVDVKTLELIEDEVNAEIKDAVDYAFSSSYLTRKEVLEGVFADEKTAAI